MEMARDYCQILDGTSPMFVAPPQGDPNSMLGKCMQCHVPFKAEVVEFVSDGLKPEH